MKKYNEPVKMVAKRSFCFGSFPKTYITGNIGDEFTVIGETEKNYITTNEKNNKLPKWIMQDKI